MISSFRLPDLVLGVSIRADTTGARQAAQQLKQAIGSQFGAASGGMLGGSSQALLGPAIGNFLGYSMARSFRSSMAKGLAGGAVRKQIMDSVFNGPKKAIEGMAQKSTGFSGWMSGLAASLGIRGSHGAGNTVAAGAKAATAGAKAAAGSSGWWTSLGATFASGNMMRGIKMAAARFWPLLIVLLAYEFIKHVMVPAIKAATGYIRKSGATGYYGEYGRRASETPVLLKNVQVQFGLMAVTLLDLLPIMESLNAGLMRLGTVFGLMAKHPNMIKSQLAGMGAIGAYLVALPYVMKFVAWATKWIPDTGGQDLGAGGRSPKLSGAYLEGSVEAYSTIRGTMQRYAADTARNTKEASETLKKILARGPEMGVVAG